MVDEYNGYPSVNHSGATAGYRAWLAYYPDQDLSIVYLANDGSLSTTGTGSRIAALFLGTPPATETNRETNAVTSYDIDKDVLAAFAGRYVSKACDGELVATLDGDTALLMTAPSNRRHRLKPIAKDRFSQGPQHAFRFERNKQGEITGFYVSVPRARNVWFERVAE